MNLRRVWLGHELHGRLARTLGGVGRERRQAALGDGVGGVGGGLTRQPALSVQMCRHSERRDGRSAAVVAVEVEEWMGTEEVDERAGAVADG